MLKSVLSDKILVEPPIAATEIIDQNDIHLMKIDTVQAVQISDEQQVYSTRKLLVPEVKPIDVDCQGPQTPELTKRRSTFQRLEKAKEIQSPQEEDMPQLTRFDTETAGPT